MPEQLAVTKLRMPFEGVPWPRHLERLLDLALAVPLGVVRVCLEHQMQSDAIRRNQMQSDPVRVCLEHLEGGNQVQASAVNCSPKWNH